MRKLLFLLTWLVLLSGSALAQTGPLTVTDNTVTCYNCRKIVFGSITVSGTTATVAGGGGGSGTVTSVAQSFTGGLISVAGSPVTTSGTLALTVAGTSGGIPYFSSTSTWASSPLLAANALMIGGGAGNSPATASGLVYASSGSPTFSVTGQSASQLTTLITGANTSSAALLGIQLGTGGSGGDFIQFRNSSGTPLSVVDANGAAGFGITSSLGARVHSVAGGSGNAGRFDGAALSVNTVLVARQGGSSTGNLFETQSSGGTAFFTIANNGQLLSSLPVTTGTGTSAGFQLVADSLTSGNAIDLSSTSATSGSLFAIASTSTAAASNTLTGLKIAMSGANSSSAQLVSGATISVTNTNATSGTNAALTLSASGATGSVGTAPNRALNITAGQSVFPDGTNLLPSLTFSTNKATGMYLISSSVIGFTSNASQAMALNGFDLVIQNNGSLGITSAAGTTADVILDRSAAAHWKWGSNTPAASPVAQTQSVQDGTGTNIAGANWTMAGSRGTGTGVGGSIVFQTAPAGSSGTSQNALVTAVTIPSTGGLLFPELSSAPATPASNNVQLYAKDNGSGVSNLYFKKDDGVEVNLSAVGSGIASINSDTTSAQTISGADDLTASTSSGTTTIQRVTNNAANVALMLPSMGGIPVVTDSASALVGSNNEIRVALIQVTQKATYNNVAFTGVTNSASGTASFAIYSLDGNTRVCYSGAISTTSWSGAGNQALSAACTLSPGLYWQAWTADNTTATARSAAGFANYFQTANQGSKALGATSTTATSGALPSTISTTITTNSSYPIPFFKLYN